MSNVLTVDLASKMSAAMVRDFETREIRCQFDSYGKSSFAFVKELRKAADEWDVQLVIVEDVPYGISQQSMVKPVLRLHGVVMVLLHPWLDRMLFLNPSTWQKEFPGVARGDAKDRVAAAASHAEQRGYLPPDLIAAYVASLPEGTKVLKKHTNPLAKVMTDYIDAFLMSEWVLSHEGIASIYGLTGVQPATI